MPALTRRRALAFLALILGAYLLGPLLILLGAGIELHALIAAGLVALAIGSTASFALKALAILAATVPTWRRALSLALWAMPAVAFWALAAQQMRG